MKLTEKQKQFADEYIRNGGNGTKAALKAGYSKKSARTIAKENITKPHILEYINSKLKPVEEKRTFDVEQAINELINLIEGKSLVNRSKHTDNLKKKVTKDVTYEYSADVETRLKAIELYLKYKGAFDKKEDTSQADSFKDALLKAYKNRSGLE